MVNARVLKFHIHIPHEKIVDPYFLYGQVMPLFMPPTSEEVGGHIGLGLSVQCSAVSE